MSANSNATARNSPRGASKRARTDPLALAGGDDTPDDDIPELADDFASRAVLHRAGKPVGRPKAEVTKQAISLRLDPEIVAHFREDGPGWQTRINDALRRVVKRAR